MRIVVLDRKVFIAKREYVLHGSIEPHRRQQLRRARQLQTSLLKVIEIKMRIAKRVYEIARLVADHLRHHLREQRIGCDIEWHAEENIRRTLIELTRQFALGDIKLEKAVARRQCHLVDLGRIPSGNDEPPRIGIALDHRDDVADLVDGLAVLRWP